MFSLATAIAQYNLKPKTTKERNYPHSRTLFGASSYAPSRFDRMLDVVDDDASLWGLDDDDDAYSRFMNQALSEFLPIAEQPTENHGGFDFEDYLEFVGLASMEAEAEIAEVAQ